jgi:cyanophycin synthetase
MFDEIIIRQDRNLRGRSEQELIDLMLSGVRSVSADIPVKVVKLELEAIDQALKSAVKGSFIVICSDVVPDALEQVMKFKEDEDRFMLRQDDFQKVE